MTQSDQPVEWWRYKALPKSVGRTASSAILHSAGRSSPIAFWALMAFTFALLIAPQSFIPLLAPVHIAFLSAILAAMAYILGRIRHREKIIEFTHEVSIALCLVMWAIVTLPFSIWPGGSVAFLFSIYLKALLIFWLLGRIVDSLKRLCIVAWILSLIAIPLSISAVKSFFSGGFLHQELSHGLDRIAGYDASLTANPNDLALMLNLILPLTIALYFGTKQTPTKTLLLGTIVLIVFAIIATYSRGGFLTMGVTFVAYLWLLARRRKYRLVLLAIVLMIISVPLLPSSYITRLTTITNIQADRTGSAQARWSDSIAAIKYVASHPVTGAGIGNNILALNKVRGSTWIQVHNIYLVYAVELGIPGLLLFIALLWKSIKNTTTAKYLLLRQAEPGQAYYLAEGIGVSLIAFSVAAFFYPDAYQFYFYYMAGLAIALRSIIDLESHDGESRTREYQATAG